MTSRWVVITGGTRGLGQALSLAFGKTGYGVLALYKTDQDAAHTLETEFKILGITGRSFLHSVGNSFPTLPELDTASELILINNASAPFSPTPLHLLSWQDFEAQIDVAVKGAYQCSIALLRKMVPLKSGKIVNILSTATSNHPPKGFGAYVTAKYALMGLTRAIVSEYSKSGIRVFSVSPGFMDTSLTQSWNERFRAGQKTQDIHQVAQFVLKKIEDPAIPGLGENYLVEG